MPTYQHPGVYVEHVPSGVLAIEAASTSVAAFVGYPRRGTLVSATEGKPVFVESVNQFAQAFGDVTKGGGAIRDLGAAPDSFGHAVSGFFGNGGAKAYIVPIAARASGAAGRVATAALTVPGGVITLTARSSGEWLNDMGARFTLVAPDANAARSEYSLTIGRKTGKTEQRVTTGTTLAAFQMLEPVEVITGVVLDPTSGNHVVAKTDKGSVLVTATFAAGAGANVANAEATIAGGSENGAPTQAEYVTAFERLKDYRDISIVLLPGHAWAGTSRAIIESAITHAEFMQNRMVIVDPQPTATTRLTSPADVKAEGFPTSSYAALYYPYMTVTNPFFDKDVAADKPTTFDIGPSAAAAGMWARIDAKRGVWKAPAGLEAEVRGSLGPTLLIGNGLQDNLNEWGVNCLRPIIGPTVIWGARTLATKVKPEHRYIPVRRTQNMIGESLYNALQAVVFEPNDHRLWASLRGSVGDFMSGLHRAGAFQGEKASDAWYVRCGLGSTMEQGDIDAGIVRVVVGFAPLKPAEFVVVRIQQIVGQTA